ncbi:MAG TPA: hypothetical protein VN736_16070 [Candidatus Limnocylindrales bacterium]|nr:hypothetical protein [Candidatus Limnocylindrales bacterium]
MKKLLSGGLVFLAGVVSPVALCPQQAHTAPAPDYRKDARFEALSKFFGDCPAQDYLEVFLEAADDYDLDWRLLPSLSYVETTGGKAARNNNYFGWDSGNAQFSSPEAGIQEVAYRLANSDLYRAKNVDGILATYNPNPSYAATVKSLMRRIAPVQ